jgi:hypothetical protein
MAGQELSEVQQLVQASGKMVLLDKLLPKLRMEGHKVHTAGRQAVTLLTEAPMQALISDPLAILPNVHHRNNQWEYHMCYTALFSASVISR